MTQKEKSGDRIQIDGLEIFAHIGVPDEERTVAALLLASFSQL